MQRTLSLLSLFAATLAAQETQPRRGVNFHGAEKEIVLGRQLAAEFQRNSPPVVSPAVGSYLNDLGRHLLAQAANPLFTYTFTLIADDPTALHEPAAFPGGIVFVPAPLILAAADEDGLAGMLAHAIAHIEARHGTKQATGAEIARNNAIPLIFVGGPSGSAVPQGNTVAIPMGMLARARSYELEADALAVAMMSSAGYDPAALARYIGRVQPSDDSTAKRFSALPPRTERLSALQTAIETVTPRAYEPHPGFVSIQAEVRRVTGR
jgi:predicted Zn-dependent protease